MQYFEQQAEQGELENKLLEEWLPRINGECLAYLKGAVIALLYAQEELRTPEFSL